MKEVLFLVSALSVTAGLSCGDATTPVWSRVYAASGRVVVPKAGVDEPFTTYYDEDAHLSRVDYWRGHVKTFQNNSEPPGYMLRVVPIIPGTQHKVISCSRQVGSQFNPVAPQTVLPDMKNYKCADVDTLEGVNNQKWVFYDKRYMRNIKYTMIIKTETNESGTKFIPLRFEAKVYDMLLNAVSDHYFIYYDSYSTTLDDVPNWKTEFDDLTCTIYPNSTAKSSNYFNPISEFVFNIDEHITDEWEEFKKKYRKLYSGMDNHVRRLNFKQNFRLIQSVNRAGLSFKTKVNHFADWKDEELQVLRGRARSSESMGVQELQGAEPAKKEVPSSLDYRLYGAVTPVKDQGLCGGGWAYAATGALEGANFQRTGTLVTLSEQALMDCSWAYGNSGCDGGADSNAYKWVINHRGIPSADDYGTVSSAEGLCHIDQLVLQSPITGYANVSAGDVEGLKAALVTIGPISVAIQASPKSFIFYSHGIYSDPSCKNTMEDLDHYALLVGYGELRGRNYWLVKNSWSTLWGNDGYILIDADADKNICGVTRNPTYVLI